MSQLSGSWIFFFKESIQQNYWPEGTILNLFKQVSSTHHLMDSKLIQS